MRVCVCGFGSPVVGGHWWATLLGYPIPCVNEPSGFRRGRDTMERGLEGWWGLVLYGRPCRKSPLATGRTDHSTVGGPAGGPTVVSQAPCGRVGLGALAWLARSWGGGSGHSNRGARPVPSSPPTPPGTVAPFNPPRGRPHLLFPLPGSRFVRPGPFARRVKPFLSPESWAHFCGGPCVLAQGEA